MPGRGSTRGPGAVAGAADQPSAAVRGPAVSASSTAFPIAAATLRRVRRRSHSPPQTAAASTAAEASSAHGQAHIVVRPEAATGWAADTDYTVTVSTALTDTFGQALPASQTVTFHTAT